ncbi:sulfatase-like hydrolase/transferase [Paralcaligenes sp. KSB-10]|uniref:sulfatase-like hydrolase/transferase n=1 Tax=Paralcaligenes sp. KSB-10 TaxID=2901142 RepID=UPI001E351CF8|nr:sulfatase-like hydrolase/transferase [Paralcaligenes sp. KSB-10]UHL63206.1 sulfatase-like hydrolase/transferase [Paralcaligenes sp. KSB-10]
MKTPNLIIIMNDEHNKKMLGFNGHPMVKTPNLDKLAAKGTVFRNAYTNSPICVPARAALATGRYVHQNKCWDNAIAYDGRMRSWARHLRDTGHEVISIGKLHYANADIDAGFSEQIIPMHIEAGVGDLYGLIRNPPPVRHQSKDLAQCIGPGASTYIDYDRDITARTVQWLAKHGATQRDKPWVLFSSFIAPHSPLIAPPEYYALYNPSDIPLPKKTAGGLHPWVQQWDDCYRFDSYFENDQQRRVAIASYYGLCSFMDNNVGSILRALEINGLADDTVVLFLSDHGDNMGARGLWGKSTMYEESVSVPLIMSGPRVAQQAVVDTPVSLVDCYPTILDAVGQDLEGAELPGRSLFEIAAKPYDGQRAVFSEYHAAGSVSAAYMLRKGDKKYICYTGYRPELFDLKHDPEEFQDLALGGRHESELTAFAETLAGICDPGQTDAQAKVDQGRLIAQHGGADAIVRRGGSSYTPIPGEPVRLIGH